MSEKLTEIKQKFNHDIDYKDIVWLVEQAEKVEELEKEKKYWIESHKNHQKAIEVLREIAIYEGDFYSHDMAMKAKKVLMTLI